MSRPRAARSIVTSRSQRPDFELTSSTWRRAPGSGPVEGGRTSPGNRALLASVRRHAGWRRRPVPVSSPGFRPDAAAKVVRRLTSTAISCRSMLPGSALRIGDADRDGARSSASASDCNWAAEGGREQQGLALRGQQAQQFGGSSAKPRSSSQSASSSTSWRRLSSRRAVVAQ